MVSGGVGGCQLGGARSAAEQAVAVCAVVPAKATMCWEHGGERWLWACKAAWRPRQPHLWPGMGSGTRALG